jgi:HEPN domain-containing protein
VDRKGLQELSRVRLREAKALLKVGMADGAYYLAGYAVECALKACIAKETKRCEFPDKKRVDSSYSHNLDILVKLAGLESNRAAYFKRSPEFRKNWDLLQSWSEESRYLRHSPQAAADLVAAVGDRLHGVISWIKLYW